MDGFASLEPLEGGWSGRTFVADVAGERAVVRIYLPEESSAAAVDAAVLRLVRGHLPVPEVLEVRRGDPGTETPGLLVTSFVAGERGDVVLPGLDDDGLGVLGANLGDLAATLGGMPMLSAGRFADADLRVEPFPDADLTAFVAERAALLPHWDRVEHEGLRAVARQAQDHLDTVDRTVLVHSDLNPKNVLVDPDSLRVTALVDWEFAHAGHPFTDLGNLLRFERQPAYVDGVLARFTERRGVSRADALDLARAADLWALVDLAGRRGQSPPADRAEALVRAIARSGDLHAQPPGGAPGVDGGCGGAGMDSSARAHVD